MKRIVNLARQRVMLSKAIHLQTYKVWKPERSTRSAADCAQAGAADSCMGGRWGRRRAGRRALPSAGDAGSMCWGRRKRTRSALHTDSRVRAPRSSPSFRCGLLPGGWQLIGFVIPFCSIGFRSRLLLLLAGGDGIPQRIEFLAEQIRVGSRRRGFRHGGSIRQRGWHAGWQESRARV